MPVLRRYATFLLNDEAPANIAEVERLISVLQLTAYQVPPDDVPEIIALVEQAESKLGALLADASEEPQDIAAELAAMPPVPDEVEAGKYADYATTLDELLAAAHAAGPHPEWDAMIADIEIRRRRAETSQTAARLLQFVDNCLNRLHGLEEEKKLDTDLAVAVAQAAESASIGFWGLPAADLPDRLRTRVDAVPSRLANYVAAVAEARSQSPLARLEDLLSQAKHPVSGTPTWETKIRHGTTKLEQAQKELVRIPSDSDTVAARAKSQIEAMRQLLAEYRRAQLNAYQEWAVAVSRNAFDEYNSHKQVTDAEAIGFFRKHKLATVDQTLLTPEVGRVYNDVLGKLLAELNPPEVVMLESEMSATTNKKKLEDF